MESRKRGPYQKGIDKKREIMTVAMVYFSKNGFYATSMREIAKACDLTQAGLLHHFGSKEELLMTIIGERDSIQGNRFELGQGTWIERILAIAREDMSNKTEALLFSTLAAEAEDPAHPAHSFMVTRYRDTVNLFARYIAKDAGRDEPTPEDVVSSRIVVAIWDGLQLQWLIDDDFDMIPAFTEALSRIAGVPQNA